MGVQKRFEIGGSYGALPGPNDIYRDKEYFKQLKKDGFVVMDAKKYVSKGRKKSRTGGDPAIVPQAEIS